jgi:hypothetical protein
MLRLIVTFGLLQHPYISLASNARPYQVNMIVFARNDINWLQPDSEHAPFSNAALTKAMLLHPYQTDNTEPYTLLADDHFSLHDEYRLLQQSKDYHVLLAFSWWQPFGEKDDWKTIRLSGGTLYDLYANPIAKDMINWARGFSPEQTHWQIDGTIQFSLDKYLNADVNLNYLLPDKKNKVKFLLSNDLINYTPLKVFTIKQSIRTRSAVINYLDNAAFGVIIDFEHFSPNEAQEKADAD